MMAGPITILSGELQWIPKSFNYASAGSQRD